MIECTQTSETLINDVPEEFSDERIGARDVELEDCRDRDSTVTRAQFVAWLFLRLRNTRLLTG